MRLYTLGLYEKAMPSELSWKEKLEAAKASGYDFVELSIDETDEKLARLEMSQADRLEIVKTIYEVGIPFGSLCLSGHRKYPLGSNEPEIECRSMIIMEKAIQLAVDLGIRIIQLAGYDVYYEKESRETRERFEKNLRKATEMAARAGVILGFETMETEFMNTVRKSMRYIHKIESTYLNVYPDLGNLTNAAVSYGMDVSEDIRLGEGRLAAMHLKETVPGIFREVMFGTGHVNFKAGIQTAWDCGVRRFVAEFWYTGNPEWKKDLDLVANMMRPILDVQEERTDRLYLG